MDSKRHAFIIVAAVSRLHQAGYGRLRILCYVKEGISAWRHRLFASDGFKIDQAIDQATATGLYSLPGRSIARGENSKAIAAELIAKYPELMEVAKGPVTDYAIWLRRLLLQHPGAVFEMEEPEHAVIDGKHVDTPFFGQRPDHTFSVHFSKLLLGSLGSYSWSDHDPEWLRAVQERASAYDRQAMPTYSAKEVFAAARSLTQ